MKGHRKGGGMTKRHDVQAGCGEKWHHYQSVGADQVARVTRLDYGGNAEDEEKSSNAKSIWRQ